MKSTIHPWDLNVTAVPNPTQYLHVDKYKVRTRKTELVRKSIYIGFRICLAICVGFVLSASDAIGAEC